MSNIPNIRRFLGGMALLGAAVVAQLLLREGSVWFGGAVLLACAGGFAWLLRAQPFAVGDLSGVKSNAPVSRYDWLTFGALAAAAALSATALVLLDVHEPSATFWRVYLLSLATSAIIPAGIVLVDRVRPSERKLPPIWPWLLLILAVGAGTRLTGFGSLPFGTWYDEAANGLEALRVLNEPQYRPVYTDGVNASGHYLYLVVAAFQLFGVDTQSIRLISALAGIATVAAAYFAGRELFGRSTGLLLAFMVAASRWAITFSRLGMYNSLTPLFEFLTVAFLVRAFRRKRLADYVLAGLSFGFGFCFYTAFQLFAAALALFLVYVVALRWPPGRQFWMGLAVMAVSALIVIAPIVNYAYERPESYFARVQNTSLFTGKQAGERMPALIENTRKHLLMFNVRGDPNGRHNLPGEPMLDPITAALFVLGAVFCLVRLREPFSVLFVGWFSLGLMGGILSLDFEAPQSLRSIAALPAVYVLAVAPLYVLYRNWVTSGGRYTPRAATALFGLLLLPSAFYNANTYFVRQAQDFASWNAHSTPETLVAATLNTLPNEARAYVISLYDKHPTVRFLARDAAPYARLETTASLPIVDASEGDLVLLMDADRGDLYEEAKRTYPNAVFEEIAPPFGGPTVLYKVDVTREVREQLQGFTGVYAPANESKASVTRRDAQINFTWPDDAPTASPFSVEWTGVLVADSYGPYQFGLQAPNAARLYIDETELLALASAGDRSEAVVLPRGRHQLRIVAEYGEGPIQLRWKSPDRDTELLPAWAVYGPPVTNNGLLGRYYANGEWAGQPVLEQIDRVFDMYFHIPVLPRPYTVEWEGKIAIPETGTYGFGLESIDESILFIDGELVSHSHQRENTSNNQHLTKGLHNIRIQYADRSDHTYLTVLWSPPNSGGALRVIPDDALFPPQGNYERISLPSLVELSQAVGSVSMVNQVVFATPVDVDVIATGFSQPSGIAVTEAGPAVALPGEGRVVMLGGDGEELFDFAGIDLQEPFDLDTGSDGTLFVLDSSRGRVLRFDQRGEFLGDVAVDPTQVTRARGIGVDDSGGLWIANTPGGSLVRYDVDSGGATIVPVGDHLSVYGESQPVDVASREDGALYTTDAGVHKLSAYLDGSIRLWSIDIPVANSLHGSHLAVARDGSLFMTEPEQGTVAHVSASGDVLARWKLHTPDGEIVKPVGVAVDTEGSLWVTDVEGGLVLRFSPPAPAENEDER